MLQLVREVEQSKHCLTIFNAWHKNHYAEIRHNEVEIATSQIKIYSLQLNIARPELFCTADA
jgi:hypothetical protein